MPSGLDRYLEENPTPKWMAPYFRAEILWCAWHYYEGSTKLSDEYFDLQVKQLRTVPGEVDDPDSPLNVPGWGYKPGMPEPKRPNWNEFVKGLTPEDED